MIFVLLSVHKCFSRCHLVRLTSWVTSASINYVYKKIITIVDWSKRLKSFVSDSLQHSIVAYTLRPRLEFYMHTASSSYLISLEKDCTHSKIWHRVFCLPTRLLGSRSSLPIYISLLFVIDARTRITLMGQWLLFLLHSGRWHFNLTNRINPPVFRASILKPKLRTIQDTTPSQTYKL